MAKTNAERQRDLRNRRRADGGGTLSVFIDNKSREAFSKAAVLEEVTVTEWVLRTLNSRVAELRKAGRLREK